MDADGQPVTEGLPYSLEFATADMDMWAIGVLLFLFITGENLFPVNRDDDLVSADGMRAVSGACIMHFYCMPALSPPPRPLQPPASPPPLTLKSPNHHPPSLNPPSTRRPAPEWNDAYVEAKLSCIRDPAARDLIRQLLSRDPTKRLSAQEVLDHPFLRPPEAIHREIEELKAKVSAGTGGSGGNGGLVVVGGTNPRLIPTYLAPPPKPRP